MDRYDVPHGTIEEYIELLLAWNKKINLISVRDREELIERHIMDSLQLLDYIDQEQVVFDLGSGAGFPGLMLSYGGIKNVSLIESNSKKASFLTVASALSKNKVNIHNEPIENISTNICDVITARGLASLEKILDCSRNIANKKTKYFLSKGKNVEGEIKKALDKWKFKYIIHQSKASSEGCILEIEQVESNEQKSHCSSESKRWGR